MTSRFPLCFAKLLALGLLMIVSGCEVKEVSKATETSSGENRALEIPYSSGISIDGELSDWAGLPPLGEWLSPDSVVWGSVPETPEKGASGELWIAWDEENLYFAAQVRDDKHEQRSRGSDLFLGDHVELVLDTEVQRTPGMANYFHIGLSPGALTPVKDFLSQIAPEAFVWEPQYVSTNPIQVAAAKTKSGYRIEAAIPLNFINLQAQNGRLLAFDAILSDTDVSLPRQERISSLIGGEWVRNSKDRLLPAVLKGGPEGTPATSPPPRPPSDVFISKEEKLLKGNQSVQFEIPVSAEPDGLVPLLVLDARLAADQAGGYSRGLVVELNGQTLRNGQILDRPPSFQVRDGQTIGTLFGESWQLASSPDYESAHDPGKFGRWSIPPGEFNVYRFTFDVEGILHSGINNLVIKRQSLPQVDAPLAFRNVRIEWVTPPQRESRVVPGVNRQVKEELKITPGTPMQPPQVTFTETGALLVRSEKGECLIESSFSQPGGKWLRLGAEASAEWQILEKKSQDEFIAQAENFTLKRKIVPLTEGVEIRETIHNLTDDKLPIKVRHILDWPTENLSKLTLNGQEFPSKRGVTSNAANPTILLEDNNGGALALVAADDVLRLHNQTFAVEGKAGISDDQLVLAPGATYEQRWQIFTPAEGYWELVNAIRRTWENIFQIPGPYVFLSMNKHHRFPVGNTQAAKRWLDNKNAEIVAITTFHPDGYTVQGFSTIWDEPHLETWRRFTQTIRQARPQAKILRYFHSNLTGSDNPELFEAGVAKTSQEDRLITAAGTPANYGPYQWLQQFVPTLDNDYGRNWLQFGKDMAVNLGVDGIYWDEYEISDQPYHYGEPWDGVSGEIHPDTNEIIRTRSSVPLILAPFRDAFTTWIFENNLLLVGNGPPLTHSSMRFKFPRFTETGSINNLANTHLFTPIGLADHKSEQDHADTIRSQFDHLDHGCLYYYYKPSLETDNPGLTRWMYPITPLRIGPGFIVGKERILTKRSGRFSWGEPKLPYFTLHAIDSLGNEIKVPHEIVEEDGIQWILLRLAPGQAAAIVRQEKDMSD